MSELSPAPTTTVSFDAFAALDIRIATVKSVEIVEGADRLYKLTLDVGSPEEGGLGERVVASGIRLWYKPEELQGKQIVYLANLEPRTFRGIESQGMILAGGEEIPALLQPNNPAPNGARIR